MTQKLTIPPLWSDQTSVTFEAWGIERTDPPPSVQLLQSMALENFPEIPGGEPGTSTIDAESAMIPTTAETTSHRGIALGPSFDELAGSVVMERARSARVEPSHWRAQHCA
jgi:hypothetical protein